MKDIDYYHKRRDKKSFRYRLERRTSEIYDCIIKYQEKGNLRVLDIGAADGIMINKIGIKMSQATFIGIDLSPYLLSKAAEKKLIVVCADALKLPFKKDSFDAVIGAAVIEHFLSIGKAVSEVVRVLKKSGLCVFTTPNPPHDYIISAILPWYGKGHIHRVSLRKLKKIFLENNLTPLTAEGFLLLPCKFPFERSLEKLLNKVKLGFLLFNQVIAGRKQENSLK